LGLGLMPVSVSVEGTDAFDAWSRIYSYVFARPWRFILYHLIGFVYGIASLLFIKIFTVYFVQVTAWCVERGMGGKFRESIWPSVVSQIGAVVQPIDSLVLSLLKVFEGLPFAGWAISLWTRFSVPQATVVPEPLGAAGGIAWFFIFLYAIIIIGFVISFGVSLFFSLETIIYLLLRKVHDGTDFTEIYTEEVEEEELETVAEEAPEEEKPAEEEEEPEEEKPAEEEKPEE